MSLLLADVEVDGRLTDVLIRAGLVVEVGPGLSATVDAVIDGQGGALIPGLHDHHLHLLALATARTSVSCGPPEVRDLAGLARALGSAADGDGWIRGVGYHEAVAGPLDRTMLDALVPDRPVRVQHRGGALWTLNSRALDAVRHALDTSPDVERDDQGEPTGRLWRYDSRLRPALPAVRPDLAAVGRELATCGMTGVTDATPDLDAGAVELLASAVANGELPVRLTVLGAGDDQLPEGIRSGPRKIMLRDHDLPSYDVLREAIATERAAHRPVAVHCVTRESLVLTLAVIEDVGALAGDRIEHAAVVPPEMIGPMARAGLAVVTQPGLLATRGDDYLRDVHPDDIPLLYRHAGLVVAGVPVAVSSDAPFGPLDPWAAIAAAVNRTSPDGTVIGREEQVDARTALSGYLTSPSAPGGPPRRVAPGAVADLCLLHTDLDTALHELDRSVVRTTVLGGRLIGER